MEEEDQTSIHSSCSSSSSSSRPSFMENVQRLFGMTRHSRRRLLEYRVSEQDDEWTAKAINAVAKKLERRKGALEDLLHALSNPHLSSRCVTIPRSLDGRLQIALRKALPHVTFCKLWRWPDLVSHHELRALPCCRSPFATNRGEDVCINPYHYERVSQPELPHVVVPRVVNQIQHQRQQQQQQQQQQQLQLQLTQQQAQIQQPQPQLQPQPQPQQQQQQFGNHQVNLVPNSSVDNSAFNLPDDVVALLEGFESSPMPEAGQNQAMEVRQPQQLQQQQQGIAYEEVLNNQNFDNKPSHSSESVYASSSSESTCAYSVLSSLSYSPESCSPSGLLENQPNAAMSMQNDVFFKTPSPMPRWNNPASIYAQNSMAAAVVPYQQQPDWAAIAYYELNARVGEVFYCKSPRVVVDGYTCPMSSSLHKNEPQHQQQQQQQQMTSRFCLGQFSNVHRNATIENTRQHIGKGVELVYVCGQIWLSCQSDCAIFVQSLCSNNERGLAAEAVDKVTPSRDFKLFDEKYFSCVIGQRVYQGYQAVYDLAKWCSIRLSFVKGWGTNYPRRQVTETPCWIELRLHAPLKWIDNVVSQMVPGNSIDSVT